MLQFPCVIFSSVSLEDYASRTNVRKSGAADFVCAVEIGSLWFCLLREGVQRHTYAFLFSDTS